MKKALLAFLVCLFGLSLSSPVGALPLTVKLSDGTTTVLVADGGIGDVNAQSGAVTFVGELGSWRVNVTTGVSSPVLEIGSIDLNSINATGPEGGGTLTISLSDVFDAPSFPGWELNIGGTTEGTIAASVFFDPSGNLFEEKIQIGSTLDFNSSHFSGFTSGSIDPALDGTYSLTIKTVINHSNAMDNTSFDAALSPVPEPATMLLLGSGLVGLAGFGRKRLKK